MLPAAVLAASHVKGQYSETAVPLQGFAGLLRPIAALDVSLPSALVAHLQGKLSVPMRRVEVSLATHVKGQHSEIAVPLRVSVGLLLPIAESAARQLLARVRECFQPRHYLCQYPASYQALFPASFRA